MHTQPHFGRHALRPGWLRLAALPLAVFGLSGCATFWDDVTSRDFQFKGLFSSPNALVVLRDSSDGDKRAKALRSLREPSQHGGTQQEQDLIINTLSAAATSESQPLCRLAAIDALSRFKDPRAAQALIAAYDNAGNFRRSASIAEGVYTPGGPGPETVARIQCQALRALGETRNPLAVDLLVRVVRETRSDNDQEAGFVMDRRIAAARALGRFHEPQGEQVLLEVLAREKDVALRDRAHESLQEATGRKLPPDSKLWAQVLTPAPSNGMSPGTDSMGTRVQTAVFK